jgi:uncharacterized OB-fold protein
MRFTVKGRLAIGKDRLAEALGRPVRGTAATRRLADVDEDEATLAVDAVLGLLARKGVAPGRARRILVSTETDVDVSGTVRDAVLGARGRVEHVASDEWQDRLRELRGSEDLVVAVRSDAARPGSDRVAEGAIASSVARLFGTTASATVDAGSRSSRPVRLGVEDYYRLARVEPEAVRQVPMGAYIPQGTWSRTLETRYRLLVGRCEKGHSSFPFRERCVRCARPTTARPAARRGSVHTFTVIAPGAGPTEFDFLQDAWGHYASVVVKPARMPDVRVAGLATATRLDGLRVGLPVDAVFRRLYGMEGAWRYGVKFRERPA